MMRNITDKTTLAILMTNDAMKVAARTVKVDPMKAVGNLRKACYEMMSAIDDSLLCEIIDKSSDDNYPFAESLDEQLGRIADWCDDLAGDYISALKRGC